MELEKISEFRFFESSKIQKKLEELLSVIPENLFEDINKLIIILKSRKEKEYKILLSQMINNFELSPKF